jgi:hypothetical protein
LLPAVMPPAQGGLGGYTLGGGGGYGGQGYLGPPVQSGGGGSFGAPSGAVASGGRQLLPAVMPPAQGGLGGYTLGGGGGSFGGPSAGYGGLGGVRYPEQVAGDNKGTLAT